MWIWIGGGVILAGTVLAAWPGRRRRPTDPVSALVDARHGAEPTDGAVVAAGEPVAEPADVTAGTSA